MLTETASSCFFLSDEGVDLDRVRYHAVVVVAPAAAAADDDDDEEEEVDAL